MTGCSIPDPSPALAGVRPYEVPRPRAPVDLRLDGNEGAAPPDALLGALAGLPATALARYPDPRALVERLAGRLGVSCSQVFLAAGADEVLDRLCRALLAPGREAVVLTPGFEMTPRYARLAGATVVEVPWPDERFPLAAVRAAIGERTALVVLTSPNNPTGAVVPPEAFCELADASPGCLFVLDLAYGEFADEDLAAVAERRGNTIVVRTLSKAWGLAGLRVGYAVGPARVVDWLRAAGSPYPVSAPSLALALARLDTGEEHMRGFVARVRNERAHLSAALTALGARVVPSQANFVFARVPGGARASLWLRDGLAGLGLAIRAYPDRAGCEEAVRITCPGDQRALERLLHGLGAVMAPDAVLFELEDVLMTSPGNAREADRNPRDHERAALLVSREQLQRLRRHARLGVVSRRPTRDARALLERIDVGACFELILGNDDATATTPPVETALELLGVQRAWLLAATIAGIGVARAARVVPLGVLPVDAAAGGPLEEALFRAGAARVLRSAAQVEELLP